MLIDDGGFVREAAIDRLRAALDSVGASASPVIASGEDEPQLVALTTDRFAVWGQSFGAWGHIDGDGDAARLDSSTHRFFIGADAPIFETRRLSIQVLITISDEIGRDNGDHFPPLSGRWRAVDDLAHRYRATRTRVPSPPPERPMASIHSAP